MPELGVTMASCMNVPAPSILSGFNIKLINENRKPLREIPPSREYVRTNFDMRIGEKLFYLLQKEIPNIRMVITVMVTMFTCFRDP